MKQHQEEGLRDVDHRAAAAAVHKLSVEGAVQLTGDVAAGAAGAQDRVGPLAHAHQIVGRPLRAGEMKVSELADRVPRAFVDRAGDLAPLDVHDAAVHVGRGDGRGQGLVAIADQQHDVGLQPLKLAGEFHDAKADALGHRGGRRAFQLDVDFAVDAETVLPDHIDRLLEALQHHRAGGDHLQLQFGPCGDGLHHRLQPPVVGPVDQDDANFASVVGASQSRPPRAACRSLRPA